MDKNSQRDRQRKRERGGRGRDRDRQTDRVRDRQKERPRGQQHFGWVNVDPGLARSVLLCGLITVAQ